MNLIKQGTLADAQPFAVSVGGNEVPMTVTLTSSAVGRSIELSSDGVNYWTPPRDADTVPMLNVVVSAPISHVRFTGSANDKWSVR